MPPMPDGRTDALLSLYEYDVVTPPSYEHAHTIAADASVS